MIRAVAHYENGLPVVMLGLDARSLDQLVQGRPIKINLMHLNGLESVRSLPDIDVAIYLATSDRAEVLREVGASAW